MLSQSSRSTSHRSRGSSPWHNSPTFAAVQVYVHNSTPNESPSPTPSSIASRTPCYRCAQRPRYRASSLCGDCLRALGYEPKNREEVEEIISTDMGLPVATTTINDLSRRGLLQVGVTGPVRRQLESPYYQLPIRVRQTVSVQTASQSLTNQESLLEEIGDTGDMGDGDCRACGESGKVLHPIEEECLDCMKHNGEFANKSEFLTDLELLRIIGTNHVSKWENFDPSEWEKARA